MESRTYLGRYRICVDRFGIPVVIRQNAHEDTLKAIDLESNGTVAVQIEPAADYGEAEREQLENEALAARQIDHVNVPRLRDFGFDDDQLVYVTDYLEGVTADEWIRTAGPMEPRRVLQIGSQAVSALVAASLHGIIHYAVHPGNIMLLREGSADGKWPRINVLNFLGVAPELSAADRNGSTALNPTDFASPEQVQEGPVTFRSEIYSLGCTLWFLLKAQLPAGGAAGVHDATDVPAPVRQLVSRMLAEDPADRPSDPVALQQQIHDCLRQLERPVAPAEVAEVVEPPEAVAARSGLASAAAPALETWIEPFPRRRRSSIWRPVAVAALLLALGTIAALVFAQRGRPTLATTTAPSKIAVAPAATPNLLPVQDPAPNAPEVSAPGTAVAEAPPTEIITPDLVTPAVDAFDGAALVAEANTTEVADPVAPEGLPTAAAAPDPQRTEEPLVALEISAPSPTREIHLAQVALEQPRIVAELTPPAEGPIESEEPPVGEAANASDPDVAPPAQAEERTDVPMTAPQKTSATPHSSKPPTKKTATARQSAKPIARGFTRQQSASTSVGHILFPACVDSTAAKKSRNAHPPKHGTAKKTVPTPRLASDD
ncbi:MAG: protein kinase domain-containing protein [Chthoniobacterales bacterium]